MKTSRHHSQSLPVPSLYMKRPSCSLSLRSQPKGSAIFVCMSFCHTNGLISHDLTNVVIGNRMHLLRQCRLRLPCMQTNSLVVSEHACRSLNRYTRHSQLAPQSPYHLNNNLHCCALRSERRCLHCILTLTEPKMGARLTKISIPASASSGLAN